MKKRFIIIPAVLLSVITSSLFCVKGLYSRKQLDFTFDAAYYWPEKKSVYGEWLYEKLPSGHEYYLYLPEKYRNDKDSADAKLPMIVVFHGSDEKGAALSKYGRLFINQDFQNSVYSEGCAVMIVLSRINYFTDPHSTSLLIQNVVLKNKCIDQTNIIGYGFSQGAKFVVELACTEPALFRAVISGSGFYQATVKEIISVLPVQFYFAISENDKGIFEQGSPTGRKLGRFCKNSIYVQYPQRWHFWVEMNDKVKNETVTDWLKAVINSKS